MKLENTLIFIATIFMLFILICDTSYASTYWDISDFDINNLTDYSYQVIVKTDFEYTNNFDKVRIYQFGSSEPITGLESLITYNGNHNTKAYDINLITGVKTNHLSSYYGQISNATGSGDACIHPITNPIIIYSTHDIIESDGTVIYDNINDDTYTAPTLASVNFILPRNGFKDNSYMFNFRLLLTYPLGTDTSKITGGIRVNDNRVEDIGMLIANKTQRIYETSDGLEIDIGFTLVNMPYGINTIKYTTSLDGVESGSAMINVERLEGFVDEDGDGLDDRTGQPDAQNPNYDSDSEFDFSLKGSVANAMNFLDEGKESLNFMGQVYNILPSPIPEAIAFIIVISIALFIIKIVRG